MPSAVVISRSTRASSGSPLAAHIFGKYEAAVFVRNLTNEKNLIGVIDTSNYRAGVYNDPRVFGVSLSGKF